MAKSSKKMNSFFRKMLKAKKTKSKSFQYKGKTYVGKKHKYLGLIYKKGGSGHAHHSRPSPPPPPPFPDARQ